MESAVPTTDWKEIGITAGIVVVGCFIASLGALFAYDAIKKAAEKKDKDKDAAKK